MLWLWISVIVPHPNVSSCVRSVLRQAIFVVISSISRHLCMVYVPLLLLVSVLGALDVLGLGLDLGLGRGAGGRVTSLGIMVPRLVVSRCFLCRTAVILLDRLMTAEGIGSSLLLVLRQMVMELFSRVVVLVMDRVVLRLRMPVSSMVSGLAWCSSLCANLRVGIWMVMALLWLFRLSCRSERVCRIRASVLG